MLWAASAAVSTGLFPRGGRHGELLRAKLRPGLILGLGLVAVSAVGPGCISCHRAPADTDVDTAATGWRTPPIPTATTAGTSRGS